MTDVARLKQELKAWERNFRDEHGGRAPTKEDTKRDPVIGEHQLRKMTFFLDWRKSYEIFLITHSCEIQALSLSTQSFILDHRFLTLSR